jgi:hypothetical protein
MQFRQSHPGYYANARVVKYVTSSLMPKLGSKPFHGGRQQQLEGWEQPPPPETCALSPESQSLPAAADNYLSLAAFQCISGNAESRLVLNHRAQHRHKANAAAQCPINHNTSHSVVGVGVLLARELMSLAASVTPIMGGVTCYTMDLLYLD